MEIKRKYISRIVNVVETEVDNIFNFESSDIDFMLAREEIILKGVEDILNKIKQEQQDD